MRFNFKERYAFVTAGCIALKKDDLILLLTKLNTETKINISN